MIVEDDKLSGKIWRRNQIHSIATVGEPSQRCGCEDVSCDISERDRIASSEFNIGVVIQINCLSSVLITIGCISEGEQRDEQQ